MNQSLRQSISIMVANDMVVPACLTEQMLIKTDMLLQKGMENFLKVTMLQGICICMGM